ncbi:hypothetical protein GON03_16595 [Nocardioides sp. MAH-18]|uniref:Lipoprotein n=1 Tax=Nocardioides agri TaxID=2682843 RepID=A0A6L6XWH4_9ACTN|nr:MULTISPECIES: hypothetical protein [unclassified Nocardioides]MBA2955958.1 hypothetical protein [Nocardioides sp. CGMCC 1.13656]MVQ50806.1 hypothetical protein [Nocardioides sp. MAH-18]
MRRTLGILVLLLGLAGCGDGEPSRGDVQTDPTPEITQVDLLTGTAAGGSVTSTATVLPDDAAVQDYAAQFRNDELGGEVVAAADDADVPDGQQLAAAVVAVGCEVPTDVEGTYDGGAVQVSATVPRSDRQCLAPITSVALMLVPDWISGAPQAGGR